MKDQLKSPAKLTEMGGVLTSLKMKGFTKVLAPDLAFAKDGSFYITIHCLHFASYLATRDNIIHIFDEWYEF